MLERNQEINLEGKDWEKSCKLGNMIYSLILRRVMLNGHIMHSHNLKKILKFCVLNAKLVKFMHLENCNFLKTNIPSNIKYLCSNRIYCICIFKYTPDISILLLVIISV